MVRRKDPLRGTVLGGRYRLRRLIGRGGMAAVYRADDQQLDRPVAVKVLHCPEQDEAPDRARFSREARILARLDHARIVHIYQAGQEDDLAWFAMAYVKGRSLHRHLRDRKRPLGFARGLPILRGILEGVAHAHRQGVVHRDLKPANVVLTERTRNPVILDFGIAHALESARLTRTGTPLGTPDYMAPEQVRANLGDIGPAADVYACGAILHEMLTGRPPFPAGTAYQVGYLHMTAGPPSLGKRPRREPEGLEAVVRAVLSIEPAARVASAEHFLELLRAVEEGRPPPPAPAREPGAGGPPMEPSGQPGASEVHDRPEATADTSVGAPRDPPPEIEADGAPSAGEVLRGSLRSPMAAGALLLLALGLGVLALLLP